MTEPEANLRAALLAAEAALDIGDENCGRDPESVYHDPLAMVRQAIASMEPEFGDE